MFRFFENLPDAREIFNRLLREDLATRIIPMFRFFEDIPEKAIKLKILNETSYQDQARLAQVSKKFNQMANDEFLELANYKKEKMKELVEKLVSAANFNRTTDAKKLLDMGVNPSAVWIFGSTPLHMAANHGAYDVALLLLEHGASLSIRNDDSETPLDVAKSFRKMRLVELFESYAQRQESTQAQFAAPDRKKF